MMPKIICKGAKNKGVGRDAVATGMQIGGKTMSRYTDAEKLYERFAGLEAQAMAQIEELNRIPLEEMTKEEYVEWRVWSAILRERSAFKFDVADAPTADVVEVKHGKWGLAEDGWYCTSCKSYAPFDCDPEEKGILYCPNCGAKMDYEVKCEKLGEE